MSEWHEVVVIASDKDNIFRAVCQTCDWEGGGYYVPLVEDWRQHMNDAQMRARLEGEFHRHWMKHPPGGSGPMGGDE